MAKSLWDEIKEEQTKHIIKVKLTEKALSVYKERNVFWKDNIDEEGYSTFYFDYFLKVFEGLTFYEITKNNTMRCYAEENENENN